MKVLSTFLFGTYYFNFKFRLCESSWLVLDSWMINETFLYFNPSVGFLSMDFTRTAATGCHNITRFAYMNTTTQELSVIIYDWFLVLRKVHVVMNLTIYFNNSMKKSCVPMTPLSRAQISLDGPVRVLPVAATTHEAALVHVEGAWGGRVKGLAGRVEVRR